jgi:hypothetical protein
MGLPAEGMSGVAWSPFLKVAPTVVDVQSRCLKMTYNIESASKRRVLPPPSNDISAISDEPE